MEGCLVVAAKDGDDPVRARVVLVETLAHDRILRYTPEGATSAEGAPALSGRVRLEGGRPVLHVEPKGHGVWAYDGGESQDSRHGTLVYRFEGRAEDPEANARQEEVGYALVALFDTLWPRARAGSKETFGEVADYGAVSFASAGSGRQSRRATKKMGRLGAAFLGSFGARNAARPPWGWFDRGERGQPVGAWFFDPAATAKRHLGRDDDFSTAYLHAPFLGISRR
jgi:hypothetical protein